MEKATGMNPTGRGKWKPHPQFTEGAHIMKKYLIASLVVAGLTGGVAVALASSGGESTPAKQPILVVEQAVALAKHHVPGTVIKVELERKGERDLYEVKVASERGEMRELKIDAHTAELLENQRDER
jgi:uncharacterized membrane protein YkoI